MPHCPSCAESAGRTHHSGGYVDLVAESVPGAVYVWTSERDRRPVADVVRCAQCSQAWAVEHSWPGRPPYFGGISAVSDPIVEHVLAGEVEDWLVVLEQHDPGLSGLALGMALAAPPATQRAMRLHPDLSKGAASAWDCLAGRGVALWSAG